MRRSRTRATPGRSRAAAAQAARVWTLPVLAALLGLALAIVAMTATLVSQAKANAAGANGSQGVTTLTQAVDGQGAYPGTLGCTGLCAACPLACYAVPTSL